MTEVFSAFLCDDIRHEATGKLLVVGMYSQDVVFPVMPANAAFALAAQVRVDAGQNAEIRILLSLDGARVAEFQGTLQSQQSSTIWLPLPVIPMHFASPGVLRAEASVDGGPSHCILELPVRVSTASAEISSE